MKATKTAISPVMNQLAAYIARAPKKALPKSALEATKHHVLDTIAAMISGADLAPGRMAISYTRTLGGKRECTVVGSRIVTSAVNAALANGMLAHADETDDSHAASLTHPGCGIIAAALAMAEREQRDGTAFLRAVALGYDVSARLSFALHGEAFRSIGHSTHSMAPTFGAAAAGAALAQLDAGRVQHVLSYAAQQASGMSCYTRDLDHVEKAFDFGGMPARNGVAAATMVASGCSGVQDVFSGERNFFVAFDERRRIGKPPAPRHLVRDLGRTYEILNTNIKRWSVSSPIQAPLDSLSALLRAEQIKPSEIEKLTVRVSHLGRQHHGQPRHARHLHAVHVRGDAARRHRDLRRGARRAQDEDRKVRALWERIKVRGDDELQRLLPERHGIVEILLKNGRMLRHHTRAVRGTTRNPMNRAEVDEKCYHLVLPALGPRRARALCDAVWNLEGVSDMRRMRTLLQP